MIGIRWVSADRPLGEPAGILPCYLVVGSANWHVTAWVGLEKLACTTLFQKCGNHPHVSFLSFYYLEKWSYADVKQTTFKSPCVGVFCYLFIFSSNPSIWHALTKEFTLVNFTPTDVWLFNVKCVKDSRKSILKSCFHIDQFNTIVYSGWCVTWTTATY